MTAILSKPAPVMGATEPRLWTPSLRELTPDTSAGYQAIEFAEQILRMRLQAWQKWFLIHALELDEWSGEFRYAVILLLVSRQNGKTVTLRVLVLWFLYIRSRRLDHPALVLTAAQDLRLAREFWQSCVDAAQASPELAAEISSVRYANGEQCLTVDTGARHMLSATTRGAGRGLSVDVLGIDELREQRTTAAWAALQSTTVARPHALIVGASNQGDDESIVLNDLRASALSQADPRVGIFEWSAEEGCDIDDVRGWAQANPALGRTLTVEKLRSIRASSSDNDFRTENLCQRVDTLNNAINPDAWRSCGDEELTLAEVRDQVCAFVDVSADETHVTLAIAARIGDGRSPDTQQIHGELVAVWENIADARAGLPRILAQLKPRALGWLTDGTAGVLGVEIAAAHGVTAGRKRYDGTYPEHSPGVVGLNGADVPAACQSFADLVLHKGFRHRSSPLLDDHIAQCAKYEVGEGGAWRYARKGMKPIDAAYAMTGAVHLARSLPPYKRPPKAAIY